MGRTETTRNHLLSSAFSIWGGLVCVWAVVFVPHLLHSGFISDDWGVVKSGLSIPRFWDLYVSWFPLFSNRPAAPLVLSVFSTLCGDQPGSYIVANLVLWLTSLIIIATVLRKFFSNRFMVVFLALASFPSIASTVIFSIAMQLVAVASLLLWALSLYCLDRHLGKNKLLYILMSYFFVLLSLLTYEITLPLLVINVLYPSLFDSWRRKGVLKGYIHRFVAPSFLVVVSIFALQRIIMPCFMPVYSRLSPGSIGNCLGSFFSWAWALLVDFPVLMVDALQRVFVTNPNEVNLSFASILVTALFTLLLFASAELNPVVNLSDERGRKTSLLYIALLALLSASFLFILSGTDAVVGGYLNRGMTSTWILLALVIAILSDLYWGCITRLFVLALIVSNISSFMLQRENYAYSWILQNEIARSVVRTLREANVPLRKITLLGHVPWRVPSGHNDEEVFQNSWDFSGALWLADRSYNVNAMPLNPLNVKALQLKSEEVRLNYWESDFSNLWFYEYNARFGNAHLIKISTAAGVKSVAGKVAAAEFNSWPLSVPVRIRDALHNKKILMLPVFLLYGAACVPLFRRGRRQGRIHTNLQNCCRVCGGVIFEWLKDSDVHPEDVSSVDFKVTDSRYGVTWSIERCAGCGFLQSNCKDVLRYYRQMEDSEYESGRLARILQFADILNELSCWTSAGRLLDVGAGAGMLVEQALSLGFGAQGIEPSEWMAMQAEKRGLPVIAGVLPDQRVEGPYQAITLLDVIEHVVDPSALLTEIHMLLEDGGYLLLTTPDVSSFAARVFGKRWWHFRVAHISYFSLRTINLLLERCGFEVVHVKRTGWYFELSYLLERLIKFIPGVTSFPIPARISNVIVPLNLFDSLLLICRKKT